jgi:hypothetical protein
MTTTREEAISAMQDALRIGQQEIADGEGFLCRVTTKDFSKLSTAFDKEDYAEAARIARIIAEHLLQPVTLKDRDLVECHVCGCRVPQHTIFDDGCPLCSIRR